MSAPSEDDQIIVTVRRGADEIARWWLQPKEAGWQIAQIAEDLEEHLVSLLEADQEERNNQ